MSDRYDMTMIMVTHHAFQRDLRKLATAAGELNGDDLRRRESVLLGWNTMKTLLISHHEGEDKSMWPRMRAGLRSRPDDLAVLDAMEKEHERIDPLVAGVDEALTRRDTDRDRLAEAVDRLAVEVNDHLAHEERDAFPLVEVAMTPGEWSKALSELRGGFAAMRAAPEFFPWLIAEATPADRDAVLTRVPPPLRLLYKKVWLPRYSRTPRW